MLWSKKSVSIAHGLNLTVLKRTVCTPVNGTPPPPPRILFGPRWLPLLQNASDVTGPLVNWWRKTQAQTSLTWFKLHFNAHECIYFFYIASLWPQTSYRELETRILGAVANLAVATREQWLVFVLWFNDNYQVLRLIGHFTVCSNLSLWFRCFARVFALFRSTRFNTLNSLFYATWKGPNYKLAAIVAAAVTAVW